MVDKVMVFIAVGIVAWLVNFLIARLKGWETLGVLNLAALLPVLGVFVLDVLFGKTGFFGAIVAFMSLGVVMLLTVVSVGVLLATTITEKIGVKEKVRT